MQGLDTDYWWFRLLLKDVLKLETRLLQNKESAQITPGGVKTTNCNAQASVSENVSLEGI